MDDPGVPVAFGDRAASAVDVEGSEGVADADTVADVELTAGDEFFGLVEG